MVTFDLLHISVAAREADAPGHGNLVGSAVDLLQWCQNPGLGTTDPTKFLCFSAYFFYLWLLLQTRLQIFSSQPNTHMNNNTNSRPNIDARRDCGCRPGVSATLAATPQTTPHHKSIVRSCLFNTCGNRLNMLQRVPKCDNKINS